MPRKIKCVFREMTFEECHKAEEIFVGIESCARFAAIAMDNEKPWRAEGDLEDIMESIIELNKYLKGK